MKSVFRDSRDNLCYEPPRPQEGQRKKNKRDSDRREDHPAYPDLEYQTSSTQKPGLVTELSGKDADIFAKRL